MRYLIALTIFISVAAFISDKRFPTVSQYNFPEIPHFPGMPHSEDNLVSEEGQLLGRHLFYDKILSADKTISCASCHKQKAAFSDGPNQFSMGSNNTVSQRNTSPLFNLAWYESMFWDGRAKTIEDQVFHPVASHSEMNLQWDSATARIKNSERYSEMFLKAFGAREIDSVLISKAIAQFERTLISADSKYDRVLKGDAHFTKEERAGFIIANEQHLGNCLHCHPTDSDPLGTTGGFSNNGLQFAINTYDFLDAGRGELSQNPNEYGQFKIPSLRNLLFTSPYMHDGRFETLEEVIEFYSSGIQHSLTIDSKMINNKEGGVQLTEEQKEHLLSFLITLTDSTFIQNPQFGDPNI